MFDTSKKSGWFFSNFYYIFRTVSRPRIQYYNNTAAFVESQDKSNFKGLTEEQVDIIGTNESQTGQLYEMMQEAQKTKTQFLMVEQDGNPHDSGKKE